VKALSKEEIYEKCCPLVVCDVKAVREAIRISGLSLKVRSVSQASEGECEYGTIDAVCWEFSRARSAPVDPLHMFGTRV
jgi:4-hydroxythreonine-4-phosphate dehydrogenase